MRKRNIHKSKMIMNDARRHDNNNNKKTTSDLLRKLKVILGAEETLAGCVRNVHRSCTIVHGLLFGY